MSKLAVIVFEQSVVDLVVYDINQFVKLMCYLVQSTEPVASNQYSLCTNMNHQTGPESLSFLGCSFRSRSGEYAFTALIDSECLFSSRLQPVNEIAVVGDISRSACRAINELPLNARLNVINKFKLGIVNNINKGTGDE